MELVMFPVKKFKHDHIANFLTGNITNSIKSYGHHQLSLFGTGGEKEADFWKTIIRRALVKGLLDKEIINYGLLKLSDRGREYIEKPYQIMISQDHNFDHQDDNEGAQGESTKRGTVDEELLHILKDQRKKVAKKQNLPPFIIFQDFSLEDMAIQYPINMDEMKNITGVGVGKAQKYGQPFVDLISQYVKEKDIIRAQDMVVKSIVNKSGLKVSIIQSIDRQMPLEDIASAKNLGMPNLLDEIESIVQSGTKINLDYYINQVIDEDKQEDIYEYFLEDAETESLQEALEELGEEDYSEEDIRLMRIKFFSEYGN
jgi:ATP-dependent DNA helicase RecQ